MLDVSVPSVDEHCRVVILVKQFGVRSNAVFNCLLERLQRVQCLQVSDNPRRIFVANFITAVNGNFIKFGELQTHRKIFGLIGVVQAPVSDEQYVSGSSPSLIRTSTGRVCNTPSPSSCGVDESIQRKLLALKAIKQQYDTLKAEYSSTIVDSRCIVLGYTEVTDRDDLWSSRELFSFKCLEEAYSLEGSIIDFLRSTFYVLESRRLDLSFEKVENPTCPVLQDEQKYRMGVENKNNKTFRRKCVGRLRKQVADYTLLTGLPTLAVDSYQSAAEYLKQANDYLWLAGAYEGWACAAMAAKYDLYNDSPSLSSVQRVSSMTPHQMRSLPTAHNFGSSIGHQRHRSDEDSNALSSISTGSKLTSEEKALRSFRSKWNVSDRLSGKSTINYTEIIEKFNSAIENYNRFSFAVSVEYECMMKAASIYRYQRLYVDMECFLREHIGKYLDDSFDLFDHITKANICLNSAALYQKTGLRRKSAFFSRLAVLFRLHTVDNEERSVADYRQVYPILYRSLGGYGMPENPKNFIGDSMVLGPVQIQRKALHEVFMSALRAEHRHAAIRHICYLLQVYYDYMDLETSTRMLEELACLVSSRAQQHQLNQRIVMPQSGLVIPPVQMTRFPRLERFKVCPLPAHLSATVIRPKLHSDIFIYSPFQNGEVLKVVTWVKDCACEVSVVVTNCLPYELSVYNLSLLSEGCAFEPVPVRLILAPCSDAVESVDIKLIGVPRESGRLSITGYSCEVLGVRNVCWLRDLLGQADTQTDQSSVFDVEVLPALPVLELQTSLSRAPISEEDIEPTAEITVYSGQTFEHTVSLLNSSDSIAIRDVSLELHQPVVCGGPCMIELVGESDYEGQEVGGAINLQKIDPLGTRRIVFRIFGIDPSAMAEDGSSDVHKSGEGDEFFGARTEGAHDRIPFTGRLLTCEFVFRYRAEIDGLNDEQYERRCTMPLAVNIIPAVTVAAWHVLPGDSPATRYVVVDVTNSTEWDAELSYGKNKVIGVQPREFCRVPLLCECCSNVASNAFQEAASRASHMMQMQEMERLRQILERHVSSHLDICWVISSCNLSGSVPVGPLLSSVSLLKQLVIPLISIELSVNGVPYLSEDEVGVTIGEVIDVGLRLVSPKNDKRSLTGLLQLQCYRDLQNGSYIESSDSILVLSTESLPFSTKNRYSDENGLKQPYMMSVENDYAPIGSESEILSSQSVVEETFCCSFQFLFRCEGAHKVRPITIIDKDSTTISPEELFCSTISFSTTTKVS